MEFKYLMHGLKSGATDQVLTTADQVWDEEFTMKQSEINKRQSDMSSDLNDCMTNIQNLDNTVSGVQSDIDDIHMDMNDKVDLSDFQDLKDKVDNIEVGNAIDITDLVTGEYGSIDGDIYDLGKNVLYYVTPNGKSQAYLLTGTHDIMICCPVPPTMLVDGQSIQASYVYVTIKQDGDKIVADTMSQVFVGNTEFQIQGMIDDNESVAEAKDIANSSFSWVDAGGSTSEKLKFEFKDHNDQIQDSIELNTATKTQAGLMSKEDKVRLDEMAPIDFNTVDDTFKFKFVNQPMYYAGVPCSHYRCVFNAQSRKREMFFCFIHNINLEGEDVHMYVHCNPVTDGSDGMFQYVDMHYGDDADQNYSYLFGENIATPSRAGRILDAPNDGHMYARKNGEWVAID